MPSFFFVDSLVFEENLCLVTRQDDSQWSSFVNWVLTSLIHADAMRITNRNDMPLVHLFGDEMQYMFRDALDAFGNYNNIYQRHSPPLPPRSGRNRIRSHEAILGQLYAPPWL